MATQTLDLNNLPNLEKLTLNDPANLDTLNDFQNLKELTIVTNI